MSAGAIIGYWIQYTVYNGVSTIMGFCQVGELDVIHPKIGFDISNICGIINIESQGTRL